MIFFHLSIALCLLKGSALLAIKFDMLQQHIITLEQKKKEELNLNKVAQQRRQRASISKLVCRHGFHLRLLLLPLFQVHFKGLSGGLILGSLVPINSEL